MKTGYYPRFKMPENKSKESNWVKCLVGTSTFAMITILIIFLYVMNTEPKAYAFSNDRIFDSIEDSKLIGVQERVQNEAEEADFQPVHDEEGVSDEDDEWEDSDLGYLEYEPLVQSDYDYSEHHTEYIPEARDDGSFITEGVQYDDAGTKYTWYSENRLPGEGLDIPGRHVGDGGYIMDGDGNICVASSDHPIGTYLETPYGAAVVYDTGCDSGTVDIYTSW